MMQYNGPTTTACSLCQLNMSLIRKPLKELWACGLCNSKFEQSVKLGQHMNLYKNGTCKPLPPPDAVPVPRPVAAAPQRNPMDVPFQTVPTNPNEDLLEKLNKHNKCGVNFMSMVTKMNKGKGLSEADVDRLLNFATKYKDGPDTLPFTNSSQYKGFVDSVMMSADDG